MGRRLWSEIDWTLVFVALALMAVGVLVVGSATGRLVPGSTLYYAKKQMLWVVLGLVAVGVLVAFDYTRLERWAMHLYALNLLLLAIVLVHGHSALGAKRWIDLGPFPLQPSEIAKILMVVTLAHVLSQYKGQLRHWRDLLRPVVLTAIPMALVMKQPDLGTALVFVGILFGMLYFAGFPGLRLILAFGGTLLLVVLLIVAHLKFGLPLPIKGYQLTRLLVFTNPNLDPTGSGYNIIQSKIAIGSGGVLGAGLFHNWDQLTFLPENYTDFIFAVVGLELGFVGAVAIMLLYLLLIWRALRTAMASNDLFGSLLVVGAVSLWTVHILMNAGMAMGIMPVAGVPLPFISYGGSSLLANALALGLVLSVGVRSRRMSFRQMPL